MFTGNCRRSPPFNARERELKLQTEKYSDFVWAIRLVKVHKGVLAKDWSIDPYMKKATFNDAEDRVDVEMALSSEGQKALCIAEDSNLDELFVILDDGKEPNVSDWLSSFPLLQHPKSEMRAK